eukprot:363584_1
MSYFATFALVCALTATIALDIPITCTRREVTATAAGVAAVSCNAGETMVSCGTRGSDNIGININTMTAECTAYGVAIAQCCVFPSGAAITTHTVLSPPMGEVSHSHCYGFLTGCAPLFISGNSSDIEGAFSDDGGYRRMLDMEPATKTSRSYGVGPPQNASWISSSGCFATAKTGTEVQAVATCLSVGSYDPYHMDCTTKAKYTSGDGFGECEPDYYMMSCTGWSESAGLDTYYVTDGGRCMIDSDESHWANAVCCRLWVDTDAPTIDPTAIPTISTSDPTNGPTSNPTEPTYVPTLAPFVPNCDYQKKYATTFTDVGKSWADWYDAKVRMGRDAFLAEYPGCHTGDPSSLEFFYQFVYDESARTLTFYAKVCCGTDKRFGSDYQVTWVPNGYGSKYEYVPNPAWIDHNAPLYDYTCKYTKNYQITLADTAWATWQEYCDSWINKGRDAFLTDFAYCGYEDSLEFFYRFSYNSNAKELTFYGHFCCGKESGKSLQFGAAYTKSGKIPNQAWHDHNPWAYEQECVDQTDWA